MSDTIPVAQLRAFVERIERIEADIKDLNGDKSEVYKELRGCGFDVKAVRAVVAKRKLDTADREERDAMFELYWSALNGTGTDDATRVHVHGASYSEAKGREYPNDFDLSDNESREMRGFVAGLTDEQKAAALAYDGEDGPIGELTDTQENHHDTDSGQRVGRADDEQRDAARVSSAVGCREGDDEGLEGQGGGVHGTPAYRRRQSGTGQAGEPRVEHRADQDRGSRHVGGEARNEVAAQDDVGATASSTHSPAELLPSEAITAGEAAQAPQAQASPAAHSDDDIPAFIKQDKPDCLKLKDGHCRLSFATSALCSECNQRRAMARALA